LFHNSLIKLINIDIVIIYDDFCFFKNFRVIKTKNSEFFYRKIDGLLSIVHCGVWFLFSGMDNKDHHPQI